MSTQGRVGVDVPSLEDRPLDTNKLRLQRLEKKIDASPARDAVAIVGVTDATRPAGAPLTNGITLPAGASANIPHNLGRAPVGFVPIVMGGPIGSLQNDTGTLAADLQKRFLRVTNTGGVAVTFGVEAR